MMTGGSVHYLLLDCKREIPCCCLPLLAKLSIQQPCGRCAVVSLPMKNKLSMEQNFIEMKDRTIPNGVVAAKEEPDSTADILAARKDGYNKLDAGLKRVFGDEFSIDDPMSQDLLLQYVHMNSEQNERLKEVLERDPRMAQMLLDMIHGKRNAHSAVARYFGRSLMEVDEDSSEFEEMMLADEERQQEIIRMANDRKEYEANLQESQPVIEEFCRENGYEPADFMDNVWERIVFPIMAGRYTREVCTALDHALTYEKDVEDAFAAGDIKGRNTSIQRMKQDFGDGLPKGMVSVAPVTEQKPKRNSLIEKALNA